MPSYYCLRLLRSSQRVFRTESYGDVDIRGDSLDSEAERAAIATSAVSYSFGEDLHSFLRLVTVVDAPSVLGATETAQAMFEETVDLFNQMNFSGQNETLLPIGFCRDMASSAFIPITKPAQTGSWPIGAIYHVANTLYEPIKPAQYILSGRTDELSMAYIRAAYWSRMGRQETAKHLKFLYRWIAAEAMAKLDQCDDIVPKACLALGFPLRAYSQAMDPLVNQSLKSIPDYSSWRHFFQSNLEKARERRNAIVHNGFRNVEIPLEELQTFHRILTFVLSRLAGYLQTAILGGLSTMAEFWEMMPLLVSENTNLINEVGGTIIYTFKAGVFADS